MATEQYPQEVTDQRGMSAPVDVLAGVLRNIKTGTYHRGYGNAPHCNHAGSRRIPRCVPAKTTDVERASDSVFCRKCFPNGKPAAALRAVGGAE